MSDDQDGCEWVSVSSGTGLPGPTAVKQLCVCNQHFGSNHTNFRVQLDKIASVYFT